MSDPAGPLANLSRNAPCPCGSGRKVKHCCGGVQTPPPAPAAAPAPAPPATPPALAARGIALLRAGQPQAAIAPLRQALAAAPPEPVPDWYAQAGHALGVAYLRCGQFAEASAALTRAAQQQPSNAALWWDLAAAHDHQGQHEAAILAYRRAADLQPGLADVQRRLGQLYALYSRSEDAAACLVAAASASPGTPEGHLYRADAAQLRGDLTTAEAAIRAALAQSPDHLAAHAGLAGLLYNQGDFTGAAQHYERALAINPQEARCWDGLLRCRRYSPADRAIGDRMRAVLAGPGLDDRARMALHFALGKLHDDCAEYETAMRHFDAANALRGQGLVFDHAGFTAQIDRSIAYFTADRMARLRAQAPPAQPASFRPLLIIGPYRSGTTLVETILGNHPGVAAGGEITLFGPNDFEIDPHSLGFDDAAGRAAVARYLARLEHLAQARQGQTQQPAVYVSDKLPTNLFRLGALHALMPDARILHCRRDPIDTSLSIYTTPFATRLPFAARREDLVVFMRAYQRIMVHWRATLPQGCLLEVDYEDLVRDPATQIPRMLDFLGLAPHADCLRPEANPRPIATASAWSARQPISTGAVRRWRHYAPWLGALSSLGTPAANITPPG